MTGRIQINPFLPSVWGTRAVCGMSFDDYLRTFCPEPRPLSGTDPARHAIASQMTALEERQAEGRYRSPAQGGSHQ